MMRAQSEQGAKSVRQIDPKRWEKIKGIFQYAVEIDTVKRSDFLDKACAGDASLRKSVESLLSSAEQEWDLLDKPAFEAAAGLFAEDQHDLSEGETVGRYKVLGLLGTGGMGEVYLAEDTKLGRKIALKILPVGFIGTEARQQRFRQEARAASTLNHPNIVTIHEITEIEGRHFIATEFIEGETLRQRLMRGEMSAGEALDVAIQVASALAAAHRAGIVHRDIKPENIMLRTDGYVKVLDFGLAKLIEQQDTIGEIEEQGGGRADLSSGLLMGTLRYMSPEQASRQEVDVRSDIFSFGIVLYEIITGHRPFEGETNQELLEEILTKEPPMDFAEDLSGELGQIIAKALSKDREKRYQTTDDLLADLKRLGRRAELAMGAHTAAPVSSSRRRKLTAAAAALLLVGIIAIGYGLYYFGERGKSPAQFQIEEMRPISNSGRASDAAVSPDGKYVAFVSEDEGGQIIWLTQVDTGIRTELVPLSRERLAALTFSPDGNRVFYVRYDTEDPLQSNALYEISISGGPARRLISEVHSPVSFSPDGNRLAFFRRYNVIATDNALMLANSDGTGEQELSRRSGPEKFADYPCGPAWSPDGKVIACSILAGEPRGRKVSIIVIEPDNGAERVVGPEEWAWISGLAWLSDGSGIIAAGQRKGDRKRRIWMIPYPGGEAQRFTNDLVNYEGVSVAAKSDFIATHQDIHSEVNTNLWLVPGGDASRAKQITAETSSYTYSWTPDGRIVYSVNPAIDKNIYIMDADGSQRRPLTSSGVKMNLLPTVSPDGRYLVFYSDRDEGAGIYRMDIDGGNPRLLLATPTPISITLSPDSKWVVYHHIADGPDLTIWKVPIEGGSPIQLTDINSFMPTVSPDGKLIAYYYSSAKENPPFGFALIPFEGGKPLRRFATKRSAWGPWQWTRDGRAFMYIDTEKGGSNIFSQPIAGGPAKKLTDFQSDRIWSFVWSPDEKLLVCARGRDKKDVIVLKLLKQ
jgi:Tol biopolymer transport system component